MRPDEYKSIMCPACQRSAHPGMRAEIIFARVFNMIFGALVKITRA